MAHVITVAPVDAADAEACRQLLAIYQEAIEPSEQKPAGMVRAMLRDERYCVLVARSGGSVVGVSMTYFARGGGLWLLEYIAVRSDVRSVGVGRKLFEATVACATQRSGGRPGLLEVDQLGGEGDKAAERARRLQFYARLGCRTPEGLVYVLPLATAGGPPPMQILVHGLDDAVDIEKSTLREWLTAIYVEVYGRAPDDRRIAEMLAPLPATIALRAL